MKIDSAATVLPMNDREMTNRNGPCGPIQSVHFVIISMPFYDGFLVPEMWN